MELSPNRYSLSADVDNELYGPFSARKQAFEEAQEFCRGKGQALSVGAIDLHSRGPHTPAAIVFHRVEPQLPGPAGHACDFCGIGLTSETVPRP